VNKASLMTAKWAGPTIAERFDRDANPISPLRLFAAYMVLVSHAWELGDFGRDPLWHATGGTTMGTAAVLFFFVLSGFLVTPSLQRSKNLVSYARARALRIMPGFWAALLFVALVTGPLAWWYERGGLGGYFTSSPSPFGYVVNNAFLRIRQWEIGGLLQTTPHVGAWNGSLWTLFYEALAYVALIPLFLVGALGRRRWILLVAVGVLFALLAAGIGPTGESRISSGLVNYSVYLIAAFLVGSAAWVFRDRIPASPVMAVLGVGLFAIGTLLDGNELLYVVSFGLITTTLVCGRFGKTFARHNDISYGVYIYAFPVQQLFALWGVPEWGLVPYILATTPVVLGLAALSWWFVEKPALKFKNGFRRTKPPVPAPAD
jgi:peptidoglycan/LPS O-acetylase OafA/YrhL